jgi:glycerol kinase
MVYVLALDQGTTSSRAILFDGDGAMIAAAQQEFPQLYPRPGWVEHDPRQIWSSQVSVIAGVMAKARASTSDIAAIGIANQRETTVIWERASGEPIANAIVWQDRRTAPLCAAMVADGRAEVFRARTGLVVDAYFSATKIRWLLDAIPDAQARAAAGELCFGTVDSWLVWNLTGGAVHVTDASNASRTLLYDIHRGDWDDHLLALLDIPRPLLPEVRPTSGLIAETACEPFTCAVPIGALAGDQQAALFGQLCLRPGMAKCTYGTGCFLLLNTGGTAFASRNRLLTTIAWRLGESVTYALEGSVFIGGAVVQWLRDGLGLMGSSSEIETLARRVPDAGGVFFVPAFVGLGAPHWDSKARGAILGLTRGTTAAHLARAGLEAIAFQVADVVEAMEADCAAPVSELRVDGGAAANDLLMQIQADVLGRPVFRPRITETTALGAAYLAGLAAGVWPNPEALGRHVQLERRFEPAKPAAEVERRRAGWRRAVERAKNWLTEEAD